MYNIHIVYIDNYIYIEYYCIGALSTYPTMMSLSDIIHFTKHMYNSKAEDSRFSLAYNISIIT